MTIVYKETHQGPQPWEQNWCWDENRIEWNLLIGQIIHRVQLPVLCAHLDATQLAKERAEMIHIEKLIKCKRIWQNRFLNLRECVCNVYRNQGEETFLHTLGQIFRIDNNQPLLQPSIYEVSQIVRESHTSHTSQNIVQKFQCRTNLMMSTISFAWCEDMKTSSKLKEIATLVSRAFV
jgi:hypothetical protein